MAFLINPNIAYLLVVTGIMLLLWTFNNPKSNWPKLLMVVCFMAAAYEFVFLKENPWAFLVVALSPLPFSYAIRQKLPRSSLYLITVAMLSFGSVSLFVDENNSPVIDYGLAGIVSVFCASFILIGVERLRSAGSAILSNDLDSVVGLIGETRSEIESHSAGSVLIEGELWQARSKKPIPAGSTVRVVRQDGFVLTVKETEKFTKK
jgi:membrane-bound serine protease (ClpP class)